MLMQLVIGFGVCLLYHKFCIMNCKHKDAVLTLWGLYIDDTRSVDVYHNIRISLYFGVTWILVLLMMCLTITIRD